MQSAAARTGWRDRIRSGLETADAYFLSDEVCGRTANELAHARVGLVGSFAMGASLCLLTAVLCFRTPWPMVAGIAAVVLRIIYLSANPAANPTAPPGLQQGSVEIGPRTQLGAMDAAQLALPEGATVKSLSLSGDRLAVHYEAGGKDAIAILDVASGAVLRRYDVVPGAPKP